MINFNGDLLAALDVETTGLDVELHEVVQVAVLPLDSNLDPLDINPFYTTMKPRERFLKHVSPEAMEVNGLNLGEIMQTAPSQSDAADHFMEWFKGVNLPFDKRFIYLTQNGVFDIPFMKKWLGTDDFEKFFRRRGRDTMFAAAYMNDQATWKNMPIPFNRIGLKELCAALGITLDGHHDALADCIATAKVYKELLRYEV